MLVRRHLRSFVQVIELLVSQINPLEVFLMGARLLRQPI